MAEAGMVLLTLSSQNEKLTSFKGIGKIKVRQKGAQWREKIAWVGSGTAKLSIVVLVAGHPAIKMATDGTWFYYYEVREGKPIYKKIRATDATLQRIVSMPIKPSDIIQLLAGRTPLREYHSAILRRQDSGSGYVLTLKRRWWGIVEKIYLGENKLQVNQIELFNRTGSLLYRAHIDETQFINGYHVPSRLSISNDDEVGFQLEIQTYLADVPVSPSMFVLNPPN